MKKQTKLSQQNTPIYPSKLVLRKKNIKSEIYTERVSKIRFNKKTK